MEFEIWRRFRAEDKKLEGDIELARSNSLVDIDSSFMESVFEDRSESLPEVKPKLKSSKSKAAVSNGNKTSEKRATTGKKASEKRDVVGFFRRKSTSQSKKGTKGESDRPDEKQGTAMAHNKRPPEPKKEGGEVYLLKHKIDHTSDSEGSISDAASHDLQKNETIDDVSISEKVAERIRAMKMAVKAEHLSEASDSESRRVKPPVHSASGRKRSNKQAKKVHNRASPSPAQYSTRSSTRVDESPAPSDKPVVGRNSPYSIESYEMDWNAEEKKEDFDSEYGISRAETPVEEAKASNQNYARRKAHLETHNAHMTQQRLYDNRRKTEEKNYDSPARWPSYNAYGDSSDLSPVPRSPSSIGGGIVSPTPKFDDNFWKDEDDSDEIDTAAFEVYDSADDSLFGDLKSNADSKLSEEASPSRISVDYTQDASKRDFDKNQSDFSKHTDYSQSRFSRAATKYTDYSRYSRAGESSYLSRTSHGDYSLTNYLEEEGELIRYIDKWLE